MCGRVFVGLMAWSGTPSAIRKVLASEESGVARESQRDWRGEAEEGFRAVRR